ncbi:hypothetical protein SAMN06266982_102180 [Propioniciclava tarda]|nr:hypothetical protein SAMN06266982_102180 [Propioniciclava tarda]
MGARILVVAGLNLDKAWPDEAVGAARGLREASVSLLMEVAQQCIDLRVDGLIILGGLWDPTTVRRSTVGDVRTVLGSLPCEVLLVPNEQDAESNFAPQALDEWPSTVRWMTPEASTVVVFGDARFAILGPRGSRIPPLEGVVAMLTTHPSPPGTHLPVIRPAVLQGSQTPRPSDLTLTPLVVGTGGGRSEGVLLIHGSDPDLHSEDVTYAQQLGSTRHLPLDDFRDGATLTAALDGLLSQCERLDRVVVSGSVAARLLVPPALPWQPSRDDVTVDWSDLDYRFPTAKADDRTVAAELIRRLSGAGPNEARRHQALALALSSLESEESS